VPASYQLIVKRGKAKWEGEQGGHGSLSRGYMVNAFPARLIETRLQDL
jgi:hypothetical protein